jgi:hypothetical protein
VENGLGLGGTYRSGLFDGAGQRRQAPALADLFGYELLDITAYDTPAGVTRDPVLDLPDMDGWPFHYGSARTSHSLAHDLPKDGLFSFLGGYAVCRVTDDTEVIADVHTIDQVRLNARPYNRRGNYPGPARYPLAIVRQVGEARLAYFAAQAEAERRRAYAPELDRLLVRSIVWAGGPPPLTAVDCPRTVELRLFHNEDGGTCFILLVNQTTNPLVQMGRDPLAAPVQADPGDQARGRLRLTGNPAVVRYVTPQKGLQLALDCPASVKSVHGLTGAEVRYKEEDGTLLIDVPVLDLYEGIVVEYD